MTTVGDGDATIASIHVLIDQITQANPVIVAGLIDTILACASQSDDFGRKSLIEYADSLESIYTANHRLTDLEKQNHIKDLHLLLLDVQAAVDACRQAELDNTIPDEPIAVHEMLPPLADDSETLEQFRQMQDVIDDLRRQLEAKDRTIEHLHQRIHMLTEVTHAASEELPLAGPNHPDPVSPIDLIEANERLQEELERFNKKHQED